jgi:hypothetical protein
MRSIFFLKNKLPKMLLILNVTWILNHVDCLHLLATEELHKIILPNTAIVWLPFLHYIQEVLGEKDLSHIYIYIYICFPDCNFLWFLLISADGMEEQNIKIGHKHLFHNFSNTAFTNHPTFNSPEYFCWLEYCHM